MIIFFQRTFLQQQQQKRILYTNQKFFYECFNFFVLLCLVEPDSSNNVGTK